ncbi:sensor histidine kinase [Listeria valentina]|uniref:sensor histidine kinase n=1 Tax=Listeria valentina TaxID=2705293 RepID=UPI0014322C8A|nr:GHKL domain-containing protein [Listeria valentina]
MAYLYTYALLMLLINLLYIYVLGKKELFHSRFVITFVTASATLALLFYLNLLPTSLLGFLLVVMNLLILFYFSKNWVVGTLASAFIYAAFQIIWFFTFYGYHATTQNVSPFPFLIVEPFTFFILAVIMVLAHFAVLFTINRYIRKYDIYHILLQVHQGVRFIIYSVALILILLFINFIIFYFREEAFFTWLSILIILAYLLLLLLSISTVVFIIRQRLQQIFLEEQISYVAKLESENSLVQSFRHDYKNILLTIGIFLERNDLYGLKKYYNEELKISSYQELEDRVDFLDLRNMQILALKGLIGNKLGIAKQKGIEIELNIPLPVIRLSVPLIDYVRCVSILLDNAIEESEHTDNSKIIVSLKTNNHEVIIQVANRVSDPKKIRISDLTRKNFSTKGENRGKGLHTVNRLVKSWHNASLDIDLQEDLLYFEIEIPEVGGN